MKRHRPTVCTLNKTRNHTDQASIVNLVKKEINPVDTAV